MKKAEILECLVRASLSLTAMNDKLVSENKPSTGELRGTMELMLKGFEVLIKAVKNDGNLD